ncbi:YifB family Mg chelatase-like AAA ATPase [uncultured Clostridium sp.]|uniref:YifB family Mg chelatase-like AAA ATPase n=1 Tax=uncultured Clostridium sp. TaxID=59620 RepID=UPI0028E1B655|nr:YifB family Mg chelatase-like AAA ATPase [uncultured Clostridium sp.]
MVIKINGATLNGIHGYPVSVEIHISRGLPSFNIVGIGGIAVKESKERVRAAILNSGFEFPLGRITVNLAPADIKKEGTLLDLPIAIGILCVSKQIYMNNLDNYLFIGELSLLGELRDVKGALPIVMEGMENDIKKYIVPKDNKDECSLVKEAEIYPCNSLNDVINTIADENIKPYKMDKIKNYTSQYKIDFSEIVGQHSAKRGVEVAAAGNHNLALYGPPGTGKSMIAYRIPTILPDITYEESLECTKIYSVYGDLKEGLIYKRPFRTPHHTATKIALIGGGANLMPGEISLAHNGVLFLDEMLEFKKDVLEALRQPLENRSVTISRFSGSIKYPSNFMLVGAFNTCPCSKINCTCYEYEKNRYLKKLSGPMLDRIDVFLSVDYVEHSHIIAINKEKKSKDIKESIDRARKIQYERLKKHNITTNSEMNMTLVKKYCALENSAEKMLKKIYNKYSLSTRAYTKILKVSRTIADLDERDKIIDSDLIEALQYRRFIEEII